MLNKIWAGMILVGVAFATLTGRLGALTDAILQSTGEAISLCITMAGVMALWMGLMEIATRAGLIRKMTNGLAPFLTFLFPNIPKEHPARGYIATNIVTNILGLGWACTPAGLKAMEALSELGKERGEEAGVATKEMCTFLIINISSLQLVPVNMIAYRNQYGSANATGIIAPAILCTLISTIVAIVYCKWKEI